MLRDDVLIENNNYGCVIMQNNGVMKIVNYTHVQTAETRCSFLRPWTPGTRLMWHTDLIPKNSHLPFDSLTVVQLWFLTVVVCDHEAQ